MSRTILIMAGGHIISSGPLEGDAFTLNLATSAKLPSTENVPLLRGDIA